MTELYPRGFEIAQRGVVSRASAAIASRDGHSIQDDTNCMADPLRIHDHGSVNGRDGSNEIRREGSRLNRGALSGKTLCFSLSSRGDDEERSVRLLPCDVHCTPELLNLGPARVSKDPL